MRRVQPTASLLRSVCRFDACGRGARDADRSDAGPCRPVTRQPPRHLSSAKTAQTVHHGSAHSRLGGGTNATPRYPRRLRFSRSAGEPSSASPSVRTQHAIADDIALEVSVSLIWLERPPRRPPSKVNYARHAEVTPVRSDRNLRGPQSAALDQPLACSPSAGFVQHLCGLRDGSSAPGCAFSAAATSARWFQAWRMTTRLAGSVTYTGFQAPPDGNLDMGSWVNAPWHRSGGNFGGNHGERRQLSAAYGEFAPEQLCSFASHRGCWRTTMNSDSEASA